MIDIKGAREAYNKTIIDNIISIRRKYILVEAMKNHRSKTNWLMHLIVIDSTTRRKLINKT